MKVCPRPGLLAGLHPDLLKGAVKGLAFTPFSAGCSILGGNLCQISANHPCERRVTLDSDFVYFLHQIALER